MTRARTLPNPEPLEYGLGLPAKARQCAGPCNRGRSVMQFDGTSDRCKQCVLRYGASTNQRAKP